MISFKQTKRIFILLASCFLTGFCILMTGNIYSSVYAASISSPLSVQAGSSPNLTFYFQNIDVRALIQLIAKQSGLNFIISDSVKGKITLNLKDVTWQQALKIILTTQGLSSRRVGNVIYVSTIEDITSNETKQLQSEEALASLAPIKSALIKLKYTSAKDMANLLKGEKSNLLTPRGEVAIDARTNAIIIRDTAKNLAELTSAIRRLDVPAKQVLIEARIVNMDAGYEEQLGVRFGVSDTRHLSGTLAGANDLVNYIGVNAIDPFTNRLNFNVPAKTLSLDGATPGTVGLALARLGPVMLDLELSAMEGENHAQVISRPRVVSSNQQKAVIQTGEEIPYQEASSSGATSVTFKKAVLSLEITPQITPDNKIILHMKATQDTRGTNTAVGETAGGQPINIPAINTQAVESNILLNNNETVVIGGVYKVTKANTVDRIPFLGTLPVIGYLFSYRSELNKKSELLIFITPKIITKQPVRTADASKKRYKSFKGEK